MSAATERQVAQRARELASSSPQDVEPLPDHDQLAEEDGERRHQVLQGLRLELHAISSVLADAAVERALAARPDYPPYGLADSKHTETRMLVSDPEPVQSVPRFLELGKALVDTTIFHLDREFHDAKHSERAWVIQRLEDLLALFRIDAGPLSKSRMRDGLSFIYGGLHFGTGVCVQLVEVMSRLLAAFPAATTDEKAAVMARSIRPAYRLAALNIDHVILAYQNLQAPTGGGTTWMRAEAFTVRTSDGTPWRIDLIEEDLLGGRSISPVYGTLGCPARVSPAGGASAIAELWAWTVELAHGLELISPR